MKKPDKLGTVVAKRELHARDGKKIIVRIGKPQLLKGEAFYICPYRILGLGTSKLRFAPGGLDSVHALQLAFEKIGMELRVLGDANGDTLRWEGGADGDIGFPLSEELASELGK